MSEARVRLNALLARYPRLFPDGPPPWGFEVGDGWCPLLETLCARLDTLLAQAPGASMRVEQVKEKFATLRFYYALEGAEAATAEAIREAVDLAQAASAHICERCARPGERHNAGGWLCTLCTACQLRGP